jgi:hypothetical protein
MIVMNAEKKKRVYMHCSVHREWKMRSVDVRIPNTSYCSTTFEPAGTPQASVLKHVDADFFTAMKDLGAVLDKAGLADFNANLFRSMKQVINPDMHIFTSQITLLKSPYYYPCKPCLTMTAPIGRYKSLPMQ